MTTPEFRSDRARCAAIARVMEMKVFKQMIEAIFEDLELTESRSMHLNLSNPTSNVEMRLTNQRLGHTNMLLAMKMCCEPEGTAPDMPPEDYGAGEEAARMMSQNETWQPVTSSTSYTG